MITALGKYLRDLRIQHGEILKTMAEKLGVTSAFLSAVENGKKKMPDSWKAKLAYLYGLDKKQKDALEVAALESNDTVELRIKDVPEQNRTLAVLFAREFDSMDKELLEQLTSMLKKHQKED